MIPRLEKLPYDRMQPLLLFLFRLLLILPKVLIALL